MASNSVRVVGPKYYAFFISFNIHLCINFSNIFCIVPLSDRIWESKFDIYPDASQIAVMKCMYTECGFPEALSSMYIVRFAFTIILLLSNSQLCPAYSICPHTLTHVHRIAFRRGRANEKLLQVMPKIYSVWQNTIPSKVEWYWRRECHSAGQPSYSAMPLGNGICRIFDFFSFFVVVYSSDVLKKWNFCFFILL